MIDKKICQIGAAPSKAHADRRACPRKHGRLGNGWQIFRRDDVDKTPLIVDFWNCVESKVEQLEVPVPPLSVQERILLILDERKEASERTNRSVRAQLDGVNKLPSALLRRAFKGEL